MFRPLRTTSPLAKLFASLGILLTLQAAMLLGFGTAAQQVPTSFRAGRVNVFDVVIPVNRSG